MVFTTIRVSACQITFMRGFGGLSWLCVAASGHTPTPGRGQDLTQLYLNRAWQMPALDSIGGPHLPTFEMRDRQMPSSADY
jgi:hypothetical protein